MYEEKLSKQRPGCQLVAFRFSFFPLQGTHRHRGTQDNSTFKNQHILFQKTRLTLLTQHQRETNKHKKTRQKWVQTVNASIFLVCTYGIIALAYNCKFRVQSGEETDVNQSDLNNCEDVTSHKQKFLINNIYEVVYILGMLLKNQPLQTNRKQDTLIFN